VVVRLGVTDQPALAGRFRILQGQQLHLQYVADTAAIVRAWARVHYDNGVDSILYVPDQTLTGDRAAAFLAPSEVAIQDGWVTDAVVECLTAGVKRGQVYVKLTVALETGIFGTVLCSDYCYSTMGQVALGTYIQPGPGGGGGNLNWVAIKANGVPATFTYQAYLSNTIRLFREVIWYYTTSSTVATRVLQLRLRERGGAFPTGFRSGIADFWVAPNLTLTADEDGFVFADEQRSGQNDDSAVTIDNTASAPTPFPLWVPEDGLMTVIGIVIDEEADDFDDVWGLFEDWVLL